MNTQTERFKKMRESSRIHILSSAVDTFIKNTYPNTTIKNIAKDAGISTGLLYRYFDSKQSLFEEILRDAIDGLKHITVQFQDIETPRETLEDVTGRIFNDLQNDDRTTKNMLLIAQHLTLKNTDSLLLDEIIRTDKEMINSLSKLIEAGQKKHVFNSGNSYSLAIHYFASLQGTAVMKHTLDEDYVLISPEVFLKYLIQ
ncbi:TetR/AcrR family transcriptional regulator [Corticicoccus populi]|uniref:TetR/AcrR family transcriptional regulator n=1 Tax=Corticicoccus populi TaxID=1812821 RepID=A0ABW5WXC2_9STAP